MSSLTKQQQTTLAYLGGFVFSVGLAGALLYNLGSQRPQIAKLKQSVELNESQARNLRSLTLEEQSKWNQEETELRNVLLTEQVQPQFFEELTRAAADNGIEGLGMTTEEVKVDPGRAASEGLRW